jgi:hypothetical protein
VACTSHLRDDGVRSFILRPFASMAVTSSINKNAAHTEVALAMLRGIWCRRCRERCRWMLASTSMVMNCAESAVSSQHAIHPQASSVQLGGTPLQSPCTGHARLIKLTRVRRFHLHMHLMRCWHSAERRPLTFGLRIFNHHCSDSGLADERLRTKAVFDRHH